MNTRDLRIIRRMASLMPLKDSLEREKPQIDKIEFSKVTTFITGRPILKEVIFYYLLKNDCVDYVKLFTAEEIKDIYVNNHPEYKSLYDISCPVVVILLGKEVYNKQMINILNLFEEAFCRNPSSRCLIFGYEGLVSEFKNKYKNAQDRGLLNTGKTVSLVAVGKSSKDRFEL